VETTAYPGKKYQGAIKYVSPRVDVHTRTIKIRVDVENPDHTLKLGMFVSGTIDYTSSEKYLTVLNSAMVDMDGGSVVFVPEADHQNEYEMRSLALGRVGESYSQVLDGLAEGEQYVAQGAFELKAEIVTEALGGHAGHGH
jgi:multidrug efflux pump subunit AcrA (membrane-fusion protein)